MNDLISRKAVIDKAITVPIAKIVTEDKVIYRRVVFVEDIENLPPAQPERTEYIPETKAVRTKRDCVDLSERIYATYICPDCQKSIRIEIMVKPPMTCPNCGADMRGEWK